MSTTNWIEFYAKRGKYRAISKRINDLEKANRRLENALMNANGLWMEARNVKDASNIKIAELNKWIDGINRYMWRKHKRFVIDKNGRVKIIQTKI